MQNDCDYHSLTSFLKNKEKDKQNSHKVSSVLKKLTIL